MRDAKDWVTEFSAPLGQGERMSTAVENIRAIQRDALEAAAQEVEKVKLYAGGAKRIRAIIPKDTDHAR